MKTKTKFIVIIVFFILILCLFYIYPPMRNLDKDSVPAVFTSIGAIFAGVGSIGTLLTINEMKKQRIQSVSPFIDFKFPVIEYSKNAKQKIITKNTSHGGLVNVSNNPAFNISISCYFDVIKNVNIINHYDLENLKYSFLSHNAIKRTFNQNGFFTVYPSAKSIYNLTLKNDIDSEMTNLNYDPLYLYIIEDLFSKLKSDSIHIIEEVIPCFYPSITYQDADKNIHNEIFQMIPHMSYCSGTYGGISSLTFDYEKIEVKKIPWKCKRKFPAQIIGKVRKFKTED